MLIVAWLEFIGVNAEDTSWFFFILQYKWKVGSFDATLAANKMLLHAVFSWCSKQEHSESSI